MWLLEVEAERFRFQDGRSDNHTRESALTTDRTEAGIYRPAELASKKRSVRSYDKDETINLNKKISDSQGFLGAINLAINRS